VQELPSPWRNAVRDASTLDASPASTATTAETTILAVLAADEPQHIEDVIARCGMLPARVSATLMSLELAGRVRQLEGQRWIAVGTRSRRR
jgi:predicted Rossmann fold nucleotide-binding protein DprA/Smf involved in DNA uptake